MEKILNRILVPVDGSKTSHIAIEYASKLAKSSDANIHLLHVIDGIGHWQTEGQNEDSLRKERANYILEEAENITKRYHVPVTKSIAKGSVPEKIVDFAKENGIDLIVMGTRGMSGYNNPMLGHVSEKVARNAHCPVVLV
ncbi:MAG: universal stress protein [Candidatus Methanofastidiosa archaeon]|nr:universal stress protein [Candidatus Methanofastidiosa archaeon]